MSVFMQSVMLYFPMLVADLEEEITLFSFLFYTKSCVSFVGSINIKILYLRKNLASCYYRSVASLLIMQS